MNNFPWTDEMVKEFCHKAQSIIFFDHHAALYDVHLDSLMDTYKQEQLPKLLPSLKTSILYKVSLFAITFNRFSTTSFLSGVIGIRTDNNVFI